MTMSCFRVHEEMVVLLTMLAMAACLQGHKEACPPPVMMMTCFWVHKEMMMMSVDAYLPLMHVVVERRLYLFGRG